MPKILHSTLLGMSHILMVQAAVTSEHSKTIALALILPPRHYMLNVKAGAYSHLDGLCTVLKSHSSHSSSSGQNRAHYPLWNQSSYAFSSQKRVKIGILTLPVRPEDVFHEYPAPPGPGIAPLKL